MALKGNPLTEIPEKIRNKGTNEIKKHLKISYTSQLSERRNEMDLNKENNIQNNNANEFEDNVDDETRNKLFKSSHYKKIAMNKNHNNKFLFLFFYSYCCCYSVEFTNFMIPISKT